MDARKSEKIFNALETFRIELPSWGFANTGTRFGKFIQAAAATTTEEKFSDAGQVHLLTGVCPTVALHVLWDFPDGMASTDSIKKFAERYGVLPGSINPNLFQDQDYKYGSFGNPDPTIRQRALTHTKESIEIARRLHSRDISMWFADGSNYPGTANIRHRKRWFTELLKETHDVLSPGQRLLIEYKPFEPAFYHTDIADWGMSLLLCALCGTTCESTGRYRPSLRGAEYRTDRRLASLREYAGRFPLQRSPLCRRRFDDRFDRSVSGFPNLP